MADAFTLKLFASSAYDLFENAERFSGTVFSELLQSALFQMNFKYIFLLECFVVWIKCLDACIFSYGLGFLLACSSLFSCSHRTPVLTHAINMEERLLNIEVLSYALKENGGLNNSICKAMFRNEKGNFVLK